MYVSQRALLWINNTPVIFLDSLWHECVTIWYQPTTETNIDLQPTVSNEIYLREFKIYVFYPDIWH